MLPTAETNLILDTDSYKASHWLQFPPWTTGMFSYLESRGGRDPEILFFGLQYLLKRCRTQRITPDMVKEADHFFVRHGLPFNRPGWMRIAHDLGGRLPVRIRAVPEGTVVPTHNVLMTVESTDPDTFWIVSWLETLLMRVWYGSAECSITVRKGAARVEHGCDPEGFHELLASVVPKKAPQGLPRGLYQGPRGRPRDDEPGAADGVPSFAD